MRKTVTSFARHNGRAEWFMLIAPTYLLHAGRLDWFAGLWFASVLFALARNAISLDGLIAEIAAERAEANRE